MFILIIYYNIILSSWSIIYTKNEQYKIQNVEKIILKILLFLFWIKTIIIINKIMKNIEY